MDENSNAAVNLCEFSQNWEVLLDRQAVPPEALRGYEPESAHIA